MIQTLLKHSTQVFFIDGGVGVTTAPSCVQVELFSGWVHIVFSHSWFVAVSNPLADPLFLHSSTTLLLLESLAVVLCDIIVYSYMG
ncbi:MAG: hypothetical protein WA421_02835 [Nitrososphaeraceae archaeon]